MINEEENIDDIPEDFGGEPKKDWHVCVTITRGFNLKFDDPVTFKKAIQTLEKNDLGATEFDELVGEELLMYDVGFLMEGMIDADARKKLN
jgi:hypothetical protein